MAAEVLLRQEPDEEEDDEEGEGNSKEDEDDDEEDDGYSETGWTGSSPACNRRACRTPSFSCLIIWEQRRGDQTIAQASVTLFRKCSRINNRCSRRVSDRSLIGKCGRIRTNDYPRDLTELRVPSAVATAAGASPGLGGQRVFSVSALGGIEKTLDLIDSLAGIIVTNVNQSAGVLGSEQQVTHEICTRGRISSQTVHKILDEIRYVSLVLLCQL